MNKDNRKISINLINCMLILWLAIIGAKVICQIVFGVSYLCRLINIRRHLKALFMIDFGDRWDQFLKGFLIRLYGFKNEMCFSLEIVFLDILLFLFFRWWKCFYEFHKWDFYCIKFDWYRSSISLHLIF